MLNGEPKRLPSLGVRRLLLLLLCLLLLLLLLRMLLHHVLREVLGLALMRHVLELRANHVATHGSDGLTTLTTRSWVILLSRMTQ